MVIRTKLRNTSIKTPLGICIFAGAAAGTLVAMITTMSTPAVHADADLSNPPAIVAPAPLAASPAPAFLEKKAAPETPSRKRLQIIHGLASWYGGVFNGRKTANGETFNMHELTACQPNLPFGSIVRVINRRNKRSVVVRINDRGNLVEEGRVIDLSRAAAEKLAMTRSGLAKVDVEVLSLGRPDAGK
jgi:rare lipoprotein A